MAVITGLQANIGDLDSFLGAWEGTSSRLASYGATESRCVQIMTVSYTHLTLPTKA